MVTLKQTTRTALCVTAVCFSAVGCDEQIATINEDSALRAASCALNPTTLSNLADLAFTMEIQSLENQINSICAVGGIINRTDTDNQAIIVADHCSTAEGKTVNGSLNSTVISDSPVTRDWDFESVSLTQLTPDAETGYRASGKVRFQQFESENSISQVFEFDNISWDKLDNSLATSVVYGKTKETIKQNTATHATTIEYNSRIELCGFDAFALEVDTVEPLVQLSSEFFPSSGLVEARAGDGSSLSISLNGDMLAIDLDSNGDEVDDLQLSMTWIAFQGATTVATRQRDSVPTRPAFILWPWLR